MRTVSLLSLIMATTLGFGGQTLAQGRAGQSTAKPAPAAPAGRGAAQPAARSGLALLVTDARGGPLAGVRVTITGPSDRAGETDDSGQTAFADLQAGAYRLRFTSDLVTAFEREVTLTSGQTATLDITLHPAPPPREVVTEVAAPPRDGGPTGRPLSVSIPDLLEEEFVGREPRRDSVLSCSGTLRTTMVQLNDAQTERLYADSDAAYYVLGGEGTITMEGREIRLQTNGFVSVPRGTKHAIERQGRRPLVLLAVLGGEACAQAK
jgi:mannose-6-phosphate isomerase-like protein (cupin superfamily)